MGAPTGRGTDQARRAAALLAALLATAVLQACLMDPGLEEQGGECGDGVDNDGDGFTDCADDSCGRAAACVGCTFDISDSAIVDTCTGEDICLCPGGIDEECAGTGSCEYAFGRTYRIRVLALGLPDRDPAGACWDEPGCGAPDPFVGFFVDGVSYGRSPSYADVYETAVGHEVFAPLNRGSSVELRVFDEDTFVDDAAFSCIATVDAAFLRGRGLVCADALGAIISSVLPQ